MLIMELRKQLCVDCSCPPVVSVLYTTKIEPKKIISRSALFWCV